MVNSVIVCNFTSQSVQYPLKFITTIIIYAQSAYNSTNATFNFRVKIYFKGRGGGKRLILRATLTTIKI